MRADGSHSQVLLVAIATKTETRQETDETGGAGRDEMCAVTPRDGRIGGEGSLWCVQLPQQTTILLCYIPAYTIHIYQE